MREVIEEGMKIWQTDTLTFDRLGRLQFLAMTMLYVLGKIAAELRLKQEQWLSAFVILLAGMRNGAFCTSALNV